MRLSLVEPLRYLFKDEVRDVGLALGMPEEIVLRQPFPGPGLAIRIIGEVTREKLEVLRSCDWIVMDEIKGANLYRDLWQSFAVLTDTRSVGVMGDNRTYGYLAAIPRRDVRGRHDCGLGAPAVRGACQDLQPHRERGARGQPRGVRHHLQAARHD